ncbi:tetratricopeptide-like helical domain-containing protein [Tanacetum coccineum]
MHFCEGWGEVVNRLRNRLSAWKAKSLSVRGRLTLIKSILGSIHVYYLSLFKAPLKVINLLESIRARFFWGFKEGSRGISWVKWNNIILNHNMGGLGVGKSSKSSMERMVVLDPLDRFVAIMEHVSHSGKIPGAVMGPFSGPFPMIDWRYPPHRRALDELASLISHIGKVNICVWRASIHRLTTRPNLAARDMGAEVQSKAYFPGSMTDLNSSFHNGASYLYHNDKSHSISGPTNSQHYDYFPTMAATDGYSGYAKEQIRQTIVKQDSIFRHQIQELHRVYKRQRDLMNPVSAETRMFSSSFPVVDPSFSRVSTPTTNYTFSPLNKGKSTLNGFRPGVSERIVIDLEQPADVDESNRRKQQVGSFHSLKTERGFNLADLNKPVKTEENETTFSSFFGNQNRTRSFAEEPQKRDSSAKRTIFGFEIEERNRTPNFHSLPWKNTTSVQNGPRLHQNHRVNSSDLRNYNPGFFSGHPNSMINSTSRLSNSAFGFLNGSKDSVSDNLEEMRAREKHRFLDMWKNHETPEQTLPPWLTAKPCLLNVQNKAKETSVHHINLDSLQNHSQRFFNKTEMADANNTHVFKKVKTDDSRNVTKILGVPISDPKVEKKESVSETRHYIDLNMSYDEEDAPSAAPSFPESVVKIATMEIDLEAPAVLESDSDDASNDINTELVKVAAEAIVSISISEPPSEPSADTLMWLADITSKDCNKSLARADKEYVPEDMDYFEYMTLKLEDTKENYDDFKPMIVEEQKEDDTSSLSKRTPRKNQGKRGRQKRDFQKDVLPSMVSLSRREVTEDLQIFEEAFSSTGVSWQSSTSKRKAARNSRGKRSAVVPPPAVMAKAGSQKKTICNEMSLEKSLEGWGRRTRRLPRQRCQNGGKTGNHQSLALKC